jgi:DNA-binding CsgD family transcriptional regulator
MELVPDRVASMLSSIGRESFGDAVLSLFDPDFEISHCAAFVRHTARQAPKVVVATGLSPEQTEVSRQLAHRWMNEDFRVDPLLVDIERRAREVPDVHFVDVPAKPRCTGALARIVECYYDRLGIGEEATYVMRKPDQVVSISLFKRREAGAYSCAQRNELGRMIGLMLKSTERHAELLPDQAVTADAPAERNAAAGAQTAAQPPEWTQNRTEKFARLRSALLMDASQLTLREAEICAYIVLGHTVLGISLILGISTNTVATHRKRAYAKLSISSQTELFNVCLKHCI